MPSAGLPNLNRVMIAYNLTEEPDEDANEFGDDEYDGDDEKND